MKELHQWFPKGAVLPSVRYTQVMVRAEGLAIDITIN